MFRKVEWRQGLELSPFLFVVVMDALSECVVMEDQWQMSFVTSWGQRKQRQNEVRKWQEVKGLKLNKRKTELMVRSKTFG